eukprot:CAMPEP_0174358638 /NCGR_PEP_ID=MMETSP0811_2-20130205/43722_1 /TAXON_ID=73025 ORGANISM="Eutreptiella gymnastica-like, Strain CCMP1594" /NCGR_SAMPLE_ID=MMETSP0811_2 /ASSEMBLY_ACC=CAM_ASM_000667 /LENGTH=119 /DNA_ID=CAMNT_0015492575 /DNA_START=532 /DNA_END=889 /DNA_ORIENTATION=-
MIASPLRLQSPASNECNNIDVSSWGSVTRTRAQVLFGQRPLLSHYPLRNRPHSDGHDHQWTCAKCGGVQLCSTGKGLAWGCASTGGLGGWPSVYLPPGKGPQWPPSCRAAPVIAYPMAR